MIELDLCKTNSENVLSMCRDYIDYLKINREDNSDNKILYVIFDKEDTFADISGIIDDVGMKSKVVLFVFVTDNMRPKQIYHIRNYFKQYFPKFDEVSGMYENTIVFFKTK